MKRTKKSRKNYIAKIYRESFDYVHDSRNFIYLAVGIFFGASLVSFFFPAPQSIVEQILEFVRQLLEETSGMGQFDLIRFIFLNNLQLSIRSDVLVSTVLL